MSANGLTRLPYIANTPILRGQLDRYWSDGADFTSVPAASHHPAVL